MRTKKLSHSDCQGWLSVKRADTPPLLAKHATIGRLLHGLLILALGAIRHRFAITPSPVQPAGLVVQMVVFYSKNGQKTPPKVMLPKPRNRLGGMTRAPSG